MEFYIMLGFVSVMALGMLIGCWWLTHRVRRKNCD